MPTVLGVQDYKMNAAKWLDAGVSLSWLRAFEAMASADAAGSVRLHALVREPHFETVMEVPVRGVHYRFYCDRMAVARHVRDVDPDVIVYNFWEYDHAPDILAVANAAAPAALHVLRVHHELRAAMAPALLARVLQVVDAFIVPTRHDRAYLLEQGCDPAATTISIIPFGVDVDFFADSLPSRDDRAQRALHCVASCSANPVKNAPLMRAVFARLDDEGYKTRNLIGAKRAVYREVLRSARVYFAPSASEASGSRSLIEALAAGCLPVVARECASAVDVVARFGGFTVQTLPDGEEQDERIRDAATETVKGAIAAMAEGASGWDAPHPADMADLSEKHEIAALASTVRSCVLDTVPTPRLNALMDRAPLTVRRACMWAISMAAEPLQPEQRERSLRHAVQFAVEACRSDSARAWKDAARSVWVHDLGLHPRWADGFAAKFGSRDFDLCSDVEWGMQNSETVEDDEKKKTGD